MNFIHYKILPYNTKKGDVKKMLWIAIIELILAIGIFYNTQKNKDTRILFILLAICLIINLIIELLI